MMEHGNSVCRFVTSLEAYPEVLPHGLNELLPRVKPGFLAYQLAGALICCKVLFLGASIGLDLSVKLNPDDKGELYRRAS